MKTTHAKNSGHWRMDKNTKRPVYIPSFARFYRHGIVSVVHIEVREEGVDFCNAMRYTSVRWRIRE